MGGVQPQRLGHADEGRRLVGLEQVRVECPLEEGVVDAEHDVAQRISGRQDGRRDHLARVAGHLEDDLYPGVGGERLERALRDPERIMGDEDHRSGWRRCLGGRRSPGTQRDRREVVGAATGGGREGHHQRRHERHDRLEPESDVNHRVSLRRHYPEQVLVGSTAPPARPRISVDEAIAALSARR